MAWSVTCSPRFRTSWRSSVKRHTPRPIKPFKQEHTEMERQVVIASCVRTAIGGFGGSLKDVPPTDLGALVVREALARAETTGDEVDHVVFGNVIATEPK